MNVTTFPPVPRAEGTACGKVILIGEHAVVHGHAAIATPLRAAGARVTVHDTPGPLLVESTQAGLDTQGLVQVAAATLAHCDREDLNLKLHVEANIPPHAGLGSSAAVAIAVARAIAAACECVLGPEELAKLADIGEQVAHGRASGVDVAASLADGVIRFRPGQTPTAVSLKHPAWLVVGDSGVPRNTRNAVEAVAGHPEASRVQVFQRIGEATQRLEIGLREGELGAAGAALKEAHSLLSALGLSTAALDTLCVAATQAGALGAKLTGAGCGGCMVALCADETRALTVEAALRRAGAVHTFLERLAP